MGDTFHQAAITKEGVCVVINNIVTGAIELARQNLFCQRHTHSITDTLTQRACGGLYARRITVLRVTWSL